MANTQMTLWAATTEAMLREVDHLHAMLAERDIAVRELLAVVREVWPFVGRAKALSKPGQRKLEKRLLDLVAKCGLAELVKEVKEITSTANGSNPQRRARDRGGDQVAAEQVDVDQGAAEQVDVDQGAAELVDLSDAGQERFRRGEQ